MDDPWHRFDLAVCRWIVKFPTAESLSDAAVSAMVAGCETDSLVRLAGMDGAIWSELPPVLAAIFVERNRALPSFSEAVKMVADELLAEIASGQLGVRAGARELSRLAGPLTEHPAYDDLGAFVGLDDAFYLADSGIYRKPDGVERDALAAVEELRSRGGVRLS